MALQLQRTDARTNASYTCYIRIDDFIGSLGNKDLVVRLNSYVDANSAANGFEPVLPADVIQLTPTEIATMVSALKATLYGIIAARPAYAGAVQV